MTAKNFYGEAYNRAKHPSKLDQAFDRLEKAMSTENTTLADRMVTLACKSEREAFE